MEVQEKFFGKYRGEVVSNIDPYQIGRIQVEVPEILGDIKLCWALPCIPFAGKKVGEFILPPVGSKVWVEFEGGNPDYPVWVGCFWEKGDCPAKPAIEYMKVKKTDTATIIIDDTPGKGGITVELKSGQKIKISMKGIKIDTAQGGFEIKTGTGQKMSISAKGIIIDNGMGAKIEMKGPKVSVNGSALEVI